MSITKPISPAAAADEINRTADVILDAFRSRVVSNIEAELREAVTPMVEGMIKDAAKSAGESIETALRARFDYAKDQLVVLLMTDRKP